MAKRVKNKKTIKKSDIKENSNGFRLSLTVFIASLGILIIVVIVGALFFLYRSSHRAPAIHPKPSFSASYISDLTKKDWQSLWNLYAPEYQQYIQSSVGEKAYLSFLQKKFSNVAINHISLGKCKRGQTIFPYGIERKYQNTCTIPIRSSFFSKQAAIAAQLSLFANSTLVLTRIGKKTFIVGGGPTDLQAPVLFPVKIPHTVSSVPVLMYHRIASMPNRSDFQTEYGYLIDVGLTITPYNFQAQMDQLQSLGYHTITPNDLFNHLYYNLPLPPKPILLTFDDGRLSDFTNGLPILLSHHFTAMFMIPPFLTGKVFGYHNHNKYMSFNELQTLTRDGMFVENHSLKHDKPLWDIPPKELRKQLATANTELFAYTYYPIQFIAYPGKWPYAHWRQKGRAQQITINVLSQMGFAFSFLDLGQNEILENSLYPYQVPRIRPENLPAITFLL